MISGDSVSPLSLYHLHLINLSGLALCLYIPSPSPGGTGPSQWTFGVLPLLFTVPSSSLSYHSDSRQTQMSASWSRWSPLLCLGSSFLSPGWKVVPHREMGNCRVHFKGPLFRGFASTGSYLLKTVSLYILPSFIIDGESRTSYSVMAGSRSLLWLPDYVSASWNCLIHETCQASGT